MADWFFPFYSILSKEVKRFFRVLGQTLLVPMTNTLLYLMIFGVSLGKSISIHSEVNYLAFLIPGLLMMGVLNGAFQNTTGSIITSKFHGDLEDLKRLPLRDSQILWGMALGGWVRGLFVGFITLFSGEVFYLFYHHCFLEIKQVGLLVLFVSIGGLSFSLLGVFIGFWAKSIDQLSSISGFILTPLMYLGGVFFSLEHLHPFWQALSKLNPLLYFINGVRFSLLGISDISLKTSLGVSIIGLSICYLLARYAIRNGSYQKF